ncbi:TPA: LysR family transcriptional regulator [Vibrio vulnificus]|uniref:LysR family transcriptional regulator n=1 Tax=Vibrio vulnificus TaxID=672 RepID=UPI0005F0F1BE|nr:LysR family transcriptional regulator [Vibrio vulnificus]EHY1013436.1 LysR family transcriptional regulator [Vibrio vulnificus]EHY1015900.1 LysR family transcriptional regulator [Vibrio vulnificus]EHY1121014.1 LysR family transcriptional regulator [Vibrio vulnificus]EHY1123632.1 LysR family transcriptional regulator [Vibrio vulnificus]EIN9355000.1 LysR family transcriptional regulator [Vibrio vulnificus]
MKALNDLNIFVETARQGSFSQAANSLDLTPAAVSAAIKRLEEQVGFPLFVRSTRSLRLTSDGALFLQKTTAALSLLQDGLDEINSARGELAGQLYITAPSDFGRNMLLEWIDEFIEQHPRVTIKLDLSDSLTDMYSKPVDLAIRYGEPADSNLVAIPLCRSNERILCASPDYLASQPPILHPSDLLQHNCLCYMVSGAIYNKWTLHFEGQSEHVLVSGNPTTNDSEVVHRQALKGKGVANKSLMDVSQDILEGRLVRILPEWDGGSVPIYMMCTDRRALTPLMRQFQEFVQQKCCQQRKAVLAAIELCDYSGDEG